jgi:hypothetical protein
LASLTGKDRAEALRTVVATYAQEHGERLRPMAERRLAEMAEILGELVDEPVAKKATKKRRAA